jgi:PDZ domain-containing secreted protein
VKIKTFSDLTGYLQSKRPGDEVNVRLNRNGKEKNIHVLLKKSTAVQFMRMNLRNLSDKEKAEYGIEKGVKIEDAGVFEDVIEKGSLLIEINGERIYSVDELQQIDIREVAWITYINTEGEKIRLRL